MRYLSLLAVSAVLLSAVVHAQTPYLVADLNTTGSDGAHSSDPMGFHEFNGELYFNASVVSTGAELWKYSNGQAKLLKDIAPGTKSSFSSRLFDMGGGTALFFANDGIHGSELWRTDGTTEGTMMVADLNPSGNGAGYPAVVFQGKLFFRGFDATTGLDPWVSDGTAEGTKRLFDIGTGSVTAFSVLGDKLLIVGGGAMYLSDGTTEGTVQIATMQSVGQFATLGSTKYFLGTTNGVRELWKSDGTTQGTQPLLRVPSASFNGNWSMVAIGPTLYFLGGEGDRVDLWKSDGTTAGTQVVKTLRETKPGNAILTFAASALFVSIDYELWRSDGTAAGTWMLDSESAYGLVDAFGAAYYFKLSLSGGPAQLWSTDGTTKTQITSVPSVQTFPSVVGGKIYFSSRHPLHGAEPWICEDGTATGTRMLVNVNPDAPPSSNPEKLTAAGALLFFSATDGTHHNDVWRSDGTSGGTFRLTSFDDLQYPPRLNLFTGWKGSLYFKIAYTELWRSDGTVAGTGQLKDFAQGFNVPTISSIFPASTSLLMSANDGSGPFLWRSDGTAGGTAALGKQLQHPDRPEYPNAFTELAGRTYLDARAHQPGLWVTQGTDETTRRVARTESGVEQTTAAAGAIFFVQNTQVHGAELWRYDETGEPPAIVKDIATGAASSNPEQLTSAMTYLFFVANDGIHGKELWRTDGTPDGTILLKDIVAGGGSGSPANLTPAGDVLYFTANDGTHGVELWRTDGTPVGTFMVTDLRPGSASSDPTSLRYANGVLWFAANNGTTGVEPWMLNGVAPVLVQDLAPGPDSSSPADFVQAGQRLFFSATTTLGRELWAIDLAASAFDIDDVRIVEGNSGTRLARFTVSRSGSTSTASTVQFSTVDGTATTEDADYVEHNGTLSFAPGQISQSIDVVVNGDTHIETNEAFFVRLFAPSGAMLGKSFGTGIIEDDDRRAEVSIEFMNNSGSSNSTSRSYLITNAGPSTASEVDVKFSESPGDVQSCAPWSANPAVCRLEPLAPGETRHVSVYRSLGFSHYVNPDAPPGLTTTMSVTAAELDTNPSNNIVSRMLNGQGTFVLPPFLIAGQAATATVRLPTVLSSPVSTSITSSTPNVAISPESILLPPGAMEAEFTLNAGAQTGPVKLTARVVGGWEYPLVIPVVAPGATPKLDVAIVAGGANVIYGQPATVTARVSARRHDGTLPTGIMTLLTSSGEVLVQQSLDGNASAAFTRTSLPPGTTTYNLRYEGDSNFNPLAGAPAAVIVSNWPTTISYTIPPLICAGVTQELPITITTTATKDAPTGSVEVTVGATVAATLPLTPTGIDGQSRAILHRAFTTGDGYISIRYIPTSTFAQSSGGQHFQTVTCGPLAVQATANAPTSISVTWTANGAHHYDVVRTINRSNWTTVGSTTGTSLVDNTVSAYKAYLYTVVAKDAAGQTIAYGSPDLAVAMMFTEDPIIPQVTPIRAQHIYELRLAATSLQWFGANVDIPAATAQVPQGSLIRGSDITELREQITELRRGLGVPSVLFTDPAVAFGMPVRAVHITELRNAVK
ncbi:MAG TPA: ELWxxDGT repeat protein [Thermoanaerobaculia bacterium]